MLPGETDAQRGPTGKTGRHPTILSRWYADEEYRKSLSATGWKEHHIMLYDRIAVERHIYTATRAERIQNSKHWILTINAEERTQQSLNQRPDLAQATSQSNNSEKDTNLRATKNMTTWLTLKHVGGSSKGRGKTCRQIRQDRGPTCKQLRHGRQRGTTHTH